MSRESRLVSGASSLMEVRKTDIFSSCSQSSLRSLASRVIRASMSLWSGGVEVVAFGVGFTIRPARVCLGLAVDVFSLSLGGIDFWRLLGGGDDLWWRSLSLLPSSELTDLEDGCSSSSVSWIPSNVGFPSKSGRVECCFADVSS